MNEVSKLINTHKTEINENNFTKVYEDAYNLVDDASSIGKLTEIFLAAGLQPLVYMQAVPDYYLCLSDISSVTIPNTVTSIGMNAFYGCKKLTSITIPDSVTSINANAFNWCTGLKSVTIPNSVTSIGSSTFMYCTGLTNIKISDSITSINAATFFDCDRLTSVTIPEGVTNIGKSAFEDCHSLTSVTIPSSVINMNHASFYSCSKLKDISFTGTKAQWRAIIKNSKWKEFEVTYIIHCTDGDLKE